MQSHCSYIIIPLCIILSSLSILQCNETNRDNDIQYLLVFDAGSTGTRLNIFKFRYNSTHSTGFTIIQFWDNKVTPGLSAYKRTPWEAKYHIRQLLDWSRDIVPKAYYRNTTAIVRATAGLRLLDETSRTKVSKNVAQVLRAYEYIVPERDDRAVRVMSGREEAEYGWVSVNFLLDTFDDAGTGIWTYGMLDMGGGSTQITFVPTGNFKNDPYLAHFKTVKGAVYKLHEHSYLGLGGSQAKLYLFGHKDNDPNEGQKYQSECVHESYTNVFSFGSVQITVSGKAFNNSQRFDSCYKKAVEIIKQFNVHSPIYGRTSKFVVISQFFYVALNVKKALGLSVDIPGNITIQFYEDAGRKICQNPPSVGKYESYLCADIVHVIALLKEGYNLPSNQSLLVTDKINGYSTSWAL